MKTVKAALVVQNCIAGNFKKNLSSTLRLISKAVQGKADFIIFPEMNLTGYTTGPDILSISRPLDDHLVKLFSDKAKKSNTTILIGLAERTFDDKIYATHLVFYSTGSFEIYRKIHTAPFEKKYFSAGNTIPVFKSHGLTFGIQLCYDVHFPELSLADLILRGNILLF